jgi:CO/xanthine dehydrogenase FAD-binding subunit
MINTVHRPATIREAVEILHQAPGSDILAGGTDYMVAVNYGHCNPHSIVSLRAVEELRGWRRSGDFIVLGAGTRFAEMLKPEFAKLAPALAQAARTVGSPQIRNTGTLGGNLATASPAGDSLPVLAALDAMIEIVSVRGPRSLPISKFITGVKRTALAKDEIIASVRIPIATGPQEFLKVGRRNAMVIALASLALVVDSKAKRIGCALGSVGPTVIRCSAAEEMVSQEIDWERMRIDDPRIVDEFAVMCALAARPIDDHRSTADYRRQATSVLARRALTRVF